MEKPKGFSDIALAAGIGTSDHGEWTQVKGLVSEVLEILETD